MKKTKKIWRILIVVIIMMFILSWVIGSAVLYIFNSPDTNTSTNIEQNKQNTQPQQDNQQLKNLLNEVFSGNTTWTGN